MAVSLEEYEKALKSLADALSLPKDDITRDAVIQRFEFCVELGWKSAKKVMGVGSTAPKDVVREMAQNGLIDETGGWFKAIEDRNLSSHTYNEKIADQVYESAKSFHALGVDLLKRLKSR